MPATRRANGTSANAPITKPTRSNSASSRAVDLASSSPALPTQNEAVLLLAYPLTLLLGSLFSHLSPALRPPTNTSTYSYIAQSFQPASEAPSYFAQKRNVFNVFFVKFGWFWCTLALFIFTLFAGRGKAAGGPRGWNPTLHAFGNFWTGTDAKYMRRGQVFLRWALATSLWLFVTQWFFGPPLIDRGFAWTGGACVLAEQELAYMQRGEMKTNLASIATHAACKVAGGTWKGGYDISGHVYILVLGSGMLWFEMLPFVRWRSLGLERIFRKQDGTITRVGDGYGPELHASPDANQTPSHQYETRQSTVAAAERRKQWNIKASAVTFAFGVSVLSWWMLLMTAAFFHTWFEKFIGWMLAFVGLWLIYYLPRASPAVRSVLGMPGASA